MRSICRNLSLDGSYQEILRQRLNAIADEIASCGESSVQMGDALTAILEQYAGADRQADHVADGKEDSPGDGHTDRSGMTADLRRVSEEIRRLVDRIRTSIRDTFEKIKKSILAPFTIDPIEIDNIMFNEDAVADGRYGADQGAPSSNTDKADRLSLYEIYRKNGGAAMNPTEFEAYLSEMNQHGCGYAALANTLMSYLVRHYSGREAEFRSEFGYSLMKDGHPNYDALIVDLYSHGGRARGQSLSPATSRTLGNEYAKAHDIPIHTSLLNNVTPENVDERLRRGETITINYHNGKMYYYDDPTRSRPVGDHAMVITGVTGDGKYIVTSWGDRYIIDPREVVKNDKGEKTHFSYSVTTFE